MLLHGRRRIEPIISAEADRHLKLGATLGIAEDSPEVLLGCEHQLQHLIGPVAEHQEQQLVIVLVSHLLQSILLFNGSLLGTLLTEFNHVLLMHVHLGEDVVLLGLSHSLLEALVILTDLALEVNHETFNGCQEPFHLLAVIG